MLAGGEQRKGADASARGSVEYIHMYIDIYIFV